MRVTIFVLFSFLFSTFTFSQDFTILRHPALSPDGSNLAFSYQGDIWTVPTTGGKASRLTIHEAYESQPQWSPDGNRILFTSERNGNGDIYTINADGSDLKRITHHSAGDGSGSWNGNNSIYFSNTSLYTESSFSCIIS